MTVSAETGEPQPRARTHRLATLPDQDRTALIFRAASDLFADHGYVGTTMREIADALEVRAPSLYTYFPSKQQLLDELALRTVSDGVTDTRAALSVDEDVTERLLSGVRHQVAYRIEHPTQVFAVTRSIEQLSPNVRARVLELRGELFGLWEAVVRDGVDEGRFDVSDPHVTAVVLQDLCNYVQVKVLSVDERRKPEDLVRTFSEMALNLVRAAPASA